jgi:hypothetical protein
MLFENYRIDEHTSAYRQNTNASWSMPPLLLTMCMGF